MGQLVGLAIEFTVAQRLAGLQQRRRVGYMGSLGLDQRMYGAALRVVPGAVVELLQHLLALLGRQHGQRLQRRARCLFQSLHQAGQHLFELRAQARRMPLGRLCTVRRRSSPRSSTLTVSG